MVKKKTKGKVGAPFKNKNGVGHGCPPNEDYTDEDIIKLGEELLTWMQKIDEEDIPVFHLSEWFAIIKRIPYSQWQSMTRRHCFIPYYNTAKYWMGHKMISNKDFPQSYGNRFLRIYYADVKELEREDVEFEIEKKREENKNSADQVNSLMAVMQYFTDMQKKKE